MARCFSGQRLREARTAAGLSPEQVAVSIGRSAYSVHEYERGRVRPSAATLGALAAILGCPVDALYDGDPDVQLQDAVRRVVDAAPRMSSEQRHRLSVLLRGSDPGAAA